MVLETTPGFFVGPIFIYYYGIVYALAALTFYFVLLSKKKELELSDSQIDTFVIVTLSGLLLGGRIFHFLINDPGIFLTNPIQLILIREGGMSFFGAVIGIICSTTIWYNHNKNSHSKNLNVTTKAHRENSQTRNISRKTFLTLLDYGSVVVSFALIFGRLANFLNQELVGRIADPQVITWCVTFMSAQGCRHPYQLYAAASHVILAIVVLIVLLKTKKAGLTIATFFMTYGIMRFITDFWRDDSIAIVGLTIWQLFSIILAIIGIFFVIRVLKKNRKG